MKEKKRDGRVDGRSGLEFWNLAEVERCRSSPNAFLSPYLPGRQNPLKNWAEELLSTTAALPRGAKDAAGGDKRYKVSLSLLLRGGLASFLRSGHEKRLAPSSDAHIFFASLFICTDENDKN